MRIKYAVAIMILSCGIAQAQQWIVDIRSVELAAMQKDGSPQLSGGYLQWRKSIDYYGTKIEYEIGINKSDPDDKYVFFKKPSVGRENLTEYYKDVLGYYCAIAKVVQYSIDYEPSQYQVSYDCLVEDHRPIRVYIRSNADSGLYGFGVTYAGVDKVTEATVRKTISETSNHDILPLSLLEIGYDGFGTCYLNDSYFKNDASGVYRFQVTAEELYFFQKIFVRASMPSATFVVKRLQGDYADAMLSINTRYFWAISTEKQLEAEAFSWNNVFCLTIDGQAKGATQIEFEVKQN